MNLMLIEVLAPLMFLAIWMIFTFSENLVPSLITLLLTSLALPVIYMESTKLFWPCGLLLILMSTGLIVIFAYIVSLHQKDQETQGKSWVMGFLGGLMILTNCFVGSSFHKIFHPTLSVSVSLTLSLVLITLTVFSSKLCPYCMQQSWWVSEEVLNSVTWLSVMILLQYVLLSVVVLVAVAFFSLMERKILSLIHYRVGPDKVSIVGILQPISDALKLVTKDDFPVTWSNYILFYASPILMFCVSLSTFIVFPFCSGSSHSLSMIVLMVFLGMTVYGSRISGWSSNSKYALLGGMRSISQSLSYEFVFSFFMILIMSVMASYNMWWYINMPTTLLGFMGPFMLMMFIVVVLAELNRAPFDLSEGESELVSGYSVEYGGIMYTILFLSENVSIFVSCFIISYFFFYKSVLVLPLLWKAWSMIICVIRGALPRLRYDVLMQYCWLSLLPSELLGFNAMLILSTLLG